MSRFTPTRAGIINLWDYRDEEFSFVDGWLVLRGPNGSGKTKALEVLFPFVLDGRIDPRRLNPFAGEDRTMKSNLLYRGQTSSHAYVWLEFGDGQRFVTIGIGLRAHRHTDKVTRWHFVADGRVGVDFSLLSAADQPYTRKHLIAELGADRVTDSPEEYRRAVDAALFGLGPDRYGQLLDLVLTLRKPQLAKDLNPAELSRTLQRGLRPVEDTLVVEAARSFDDMAAVADVLDGLSRADDAAAAFVSVYSTYLRAHARAAADALAGRLAAVESAAAAVTAAAGELAEADAAVEVAAAAAAAAATRPPVLRSTLEALRASEAYRSQQQLADLRRHVEELAGRLDRARRDAARDSAAAARRRTEADDAEAARHAARAQVARLGGELRDEAAAAGLAWSATDAVADALPRRAAAVVTARRDDVRAVRARVGEHERATGERTRAETEAGAAAVAVEAARAAVGAAEEGLAGARSAAVDAVTDWGRRHPVLAELSLPAPLVAALADGVAAVGEADAPTLAQLYADHTGAAVASAHADRARVQSAADAESAARAVTAAERAAIAAERDDAPPSPHTRVADRAARPGAPLWRLTRFADRVGDAEAAGVEAALEAAGLLDAWLHPDADAAAAALDGGDRDGYLWPLPPDRRPAGRTLADLLTAEEDTGVPAERVTAVLASVAVVTDPTARVAANAVSVDGRYATGVVLGRHTKPAAGYIGATARVTRRAARLAARDAALAAHDARLDQWRARLSELDERLARIAAAGRDLPSVTVVYTALRATQRRAAELRAHTEAARRADARRDESIAAVNAAATAVREACAQRAVPAERLDEVAGAVERFARTADQLVAAHRACGATEAGAAAAADRLTEAALRAEASAEEAAEAAEVHAGRDQAYQALTAAIGAEVAQVLARIGDTERELADAERAAEEAAADLSRRQRTQTRAATTVELRTEARRTAEAEAARQAGGLRPYADNDLHALLRCPEPLRWPADTGDGDGLHPHVVAVHRAILTATRELSPSENSLKQSATRLQSALAELQAQLPAAGLDHRPQWETDDGVIVVRVADDHGLSPVADFARRVHDQRTAQEALLTDSERAVLEDTLLGQLAAQIHIRTIEARDLVAGMDAQMRERRMSSGMTVGVGWLLADDLDAEQRQVSQLLEKDPARLGPAQLTGLRRHFAERIKAARAQQPDRPYRELLAEALDYRRWRAFEFSLRAPGAKAEKLTKARHSQLSGGEQSVSLHLPLFAAANALFGSARPDAPRLLGLDEAFAGVDERGRAELTGLARQFDLDLFMTGYDLWVTAPGVGGVAHYDLSHSTAEGTVSAVLMVWDGRESIVDGDGRLAAAYGSPLTRRVPGAAAHPDPAGGEPDDDADGE